MARDHHFAEVFYDEVRISVANIVGKINHGWSVALSTLGFERGTAFMSRQVAMAQQVDRLKEFARQRTDRTGRPLLMDDTIADRLAYVVAQVAALRAMTIAAVSRNQRVTQPGPEGSIVKLYFSEVSQSLAQLSMDILGQDSLRFDPLGRSEQWTALYMRSYASSIAGGTSEIQRNIIGERVLGLPR